MAEAFKCAIVLSTAVIIAAAYRLAAMRIYGASPKRGRRTILMLSMVGGTAFGAIVLIAASVYRAQRAWDFGTVLALAVGAFLVSSVGLFIASWLTIRKS